MKKFAFVFLVLGVVAGVGFGWGGAAEAETPRSAVKILSWCHSPEARALALVVDHPRARLRWQYSCHFSKGSPGNRTTRNRSKSGRIRLSKWGFTWKLHLLWAGRGFAGRCKVRVTSEDGSRTWRRVLRWGRCKVPRTTSIRARISRLPMRRGHYKRVVVRVRTTQPGTLVKWHWKCRYRKGTKTNGSVATKSKSGQFRTSSYRFRAKWHMFGTWWGAFTGGCRLTYRVGQVKKTFPVYFGRSRKAARPPGGRK